MRYDHEIAEKIINSCAVLYNYKIINGLFEDDVDDESDHHSDDDYSTNESTASIFSVNRNRIVDLLYEN